MIYHCSKCDHEWMTVVDLEPKTKCDWCGAEGKPIGKDYTDINYDPHEILKRLFIGIGGIK